MTDSDPRGDENETAGPQVTTGNAANDFVEGLADTDARTSSEHRLDNLREQGGFFVEAVRLTRMPMIVTDASRVGQMR